MTYTCMDTSEAPAQQRCEGRKKTRARGPAGWAAGSPRAGGWAAAGASRAGGLVQGSRSILLLEKQLKIRAPKAAPGRRTAAPRGSEPGPLHSLARSAEPASSRESPAHSAAPAQPRLRPPQGASGRLASRGLSSPGLCDRVCPPHLSLGVVESPRVGADVDGATSQPGAPGRREAPLRPRGGSAVPGGGAGGEAGLGRRTPRADPRRTLRACLSLLPSQGSLLPAPAALLVPEGGTRAQPGGGSSEASRPRRPGLTASAVPLRAGRIPTAELLGPLRGHGRPFPGRGPNCFTAAGADSSDP